MRKILGIVIFLLTLLPLIGSGDAFTIKAQNFAFENGEYWLPDVNVTVEHKVVCECCKQSFRDDDAFDAHLRYDNVCADYYGINNNSDDDDDDIINGYCSFCGQPEDQCTCTGAICNGSYGGGNSGFGGSIGSGGGGFTGGGNSSNYGDNNPNNSFSRYISMAELKNKKGVHLVSCINLPDKLHPQTKSMECVIRAFSFLAELHGHDYQTAYDVLTKIATDKRYGLENPEYGGIPLCDALTIFDSYCELGHGDYDERTVDSYIDNGVAVALITSDVPAHMVTVIGYDNKYYYTAAGESNGNVTIYAKNNLIGSEYIYFKNIKVPYRCRHYEHY